MKVFENHDQRLVETLAQQDALDRIERATLTSLRLDLGNLAILVSQTEQPIEVRESVLQRAVEREYPPGYFLASRALVILGSDLEIAPQQIDHRQKCGRLAVRDRECLQHHPARLRNRFELEEQARLADPRLGHRRDNLPASSLGLIRRTL